VPAGGISTVSSAPASAPLTVQAAPEPAAPWPVAAAPVAAPRPAVDAFINLGAGPYPEAGVITTGNAQPWYNSPQITGLFGGPPTAQQQSDFASAVLQRVEQTFQLSGVPVRLTTDPSVTAAHTLSLVSNTAPKLDPVAIGMTDVGGSGFSFIDQEAKSAQTLDQLQWIVAHNIAHELMLAFGVPENHDQTGNFIDARNASWAMMTSPTSTFSAGATQALLASNFDSATGAQGAQDIGPQPVPEPAAWVLWAFGLGAVLLCTRTKRGRVRRHDTPSVV
jgi:hypothetical protein